MRRFALRCLIVLTPGLALLSCGPNRNTTGFSDGPEGIKYKLNSLGETERKASLGDYVFLNAVYKTERDSVFWDSRYNAEKKYCFSVTDKVLSSPLLGFLINRYAEGDSLTFKVDKTLFFRELFDTLVPWFAEPDSIIKAEFRIEKVLNGKEYDLYRESEEMRTEAAQWQQKKTIEDWVAKNLTQAQKADSLLFYQLLKKTNDSLAHPGTTVHLCYKGYFIDGKVFDEVNEEKPVSVNFGYEGQLLPGIEKVVSRMHKGETAKIIIPSHLGFGELGSSNGSVPAYTPVIYEVKIIDVK